MTRPITAIRDPTISERPGATSRGVEPLVSSTELAAVFVDANIELSDEQQQALLAADPRAVTAEVFRRKVNGMVNVRSNVFAAHRVNTGYRWVAFLQDLTD